MIKSNPHIWIGVFEFVISKSDTYTFISALSCVRIADYHQHTIIDDWMETDE